MLAGFARKPRSLPCRFFYDARGSVLFEEITQLPEYYPTRAETALLEAYGDEIAERMGDARVLVEFGSGSSRKTSLLLSALPSVAVYVPIDVAGESLAEAAEWLSERHDGLAIRPLVADFTKTRTLPIVARRPRKLGFFSGSTIGNLTHAEAIGFLANAAHLLGRGASFLIGVDLKKDPAILIPAYNDKRGVTAAFNLNLLERINRELDGDIDLDSFAHDAIYDEAQRPHRDASREPCASDGARVGPRVQFRQGGTRPHRELAQIFGRGVPSLGGARRLDPRPRLDRPGSALQPASPAARLKPARCPGTADVAFKRGAIPLTSNGGRFVRAHQKAHEQSIGIGG